MSRSNPDNFAENPATRFFDWAGGEGKLTYYDRETKTNVDVDLPFRFLVLDEVATVGGGYDDDSGYVGYWSNAIRPREAKKSQFTVKTSSNGKSKTVYRGLWADVKANVTGAKYVKGLYIAFFDDDGTLSLGYLKIRGAALTAWVEFTKDHKDLYAGAFTITPETEKKKKGSNTYYEPIFSFTDKIKDETNQAALELDRDVLQPYLDAYFASTDTTEIEEVAQAATVGGKFDAQAPVVEEDDSEDIPF